MSSAVNFSTKARTLECLASHVKSARVAPLVYFTVGEWLADSSNCLSLVLSLLPQESTFIVRSSCCREDLVDSSNAGAFLSILDVSLDHLPMAIQRVIDAYDADEMADEVLVQPMLDDVLRSGVAFSHDPNTCAPYHVVNWSEGEDTEAITGGEDGYTWQQVSCSSVQPPAAISSVSELVNELLTLFCGKPVDLEFAITSSGEEDVLWLLQARPLVLRKTPESGESLIDRIGLIAEKVKRGMKPHPFLMGKKTVYGVMPDWNPAEIIGVRPKPLALSLYRELITDSTWAYQRNNYGYRNLRSFPLMPHFFGLPYIDVRLSFNSFIPADLDEGLAGRLVDYYIDRLLAEPELHDKVEFEIVFSCYTLDLPSRISVLSKAGFSESEIKKISDSLRKITNKIVDPDEGLWKKDADKLERLKERREKLLASNTDPLERIYWLVEDGKRYGTLPFAGLARAGFIAVQMLQSLVSVGIFSDADYDSFLASVSTVSRQLARDRSTLEKSMFLSRYGHLRPGTYDVLSSRYDESPDDYFDWNNRPVAPSESSPFSFTLPQMRKIVSLLAEHGLHEDPVGLFDFLQAGIELRELAKFEFTRNLSDVLSLIQELATDYGFSRDEIAYSDISVFKELYISAAEPKDLISRSIEVGKARYKASLSTALPPLISEPEDVWGFYWPKSSPNYITQKEVTARVATAEDRNGLEGAIVFIPNADPGFDWLFSYPIAGLVTAWGGVNSHMAIRAGELALPAIIGAGEVLYNSWSLAKKLHIDCSGKRVEVLE